MGSEKSRHKTNWEPQSYRTLNWIDSGVFHDPIFHDSVDMSFAYEQI